MAITKIRQSQVKGLVEDLSQIKTYKAPIDLIENLPQENNIDGDMRVCLEDKNIYIWNDTDKEWSLSSGKGGAYTKTIILTITSNGQKEFQTGIRFDETGSLQTNNMNVSLHVNGLLINQSCYQVENVDEQMVIKWIEQEDLLTEDELALTYYDTLEAASSGGGGGKVDLSAYSTTEQMNQAIQEAISGIDLSAYSTTEQMTAAITAEIGKIDFAPYVTNEVLESKGYSKIKEITQSDYDGLVDKDPNTVYIIVE